MKIAALFLWLLVPLGLWVGLQVYGTPHIVLSYQFFDNGRRYDPMVPRVYYRCDYFGWHGWQRVPAKDGSCPWVRFFRVEAH